MEILLDTANIEQIKKYMQLYNITGVTTNPTIISREQEKDFWKLTTTIREIVGDKQLHVQVTSDNWEEMLEEAEAIQIRLGKDTYIKIPAVEQGICAMKHIKEDGGRVTATAIYTPQQAMLAASVGADYVAPYYNRMNNLNVDSKKAIGDIVNLFRQHNKHTKILGASFKNTQQIMDVLMVGGEAVTVSGDLLTTMVKNAVIDFAVDGFIKDWKSVYGDKKLYEL
ncbi:MAG: fructose-6-phosphate aldolase [Blautia sp.]|nr:fructose-6-phosphate aldolase [Blautia sp.]